MHELQSGINTFTGNSAERDIHPDTAEMLKVWTEERDGARTEG